jgi:hypothetical protein
VKPQVPELKTELKTEKLKINFSLTKKKHPLFTVQTNRLMQFRRAVALIVKIMTDT